VLYYEDIELNSPKISEPYVVKKEEVMSFASQWDPQPFHISEEEASKWPLGLTASSVHTIAISVKLSTSMNNLDTAVVAGLGWDEVRMPNPVRPGDALRVKAFVASKRESQSKPALGIITSRVEVYNQDDELVLSYNISSMVLKQNHTELMASPDL